MKRQVGLSVSVTGKDGSGIIAGLTRILFKFGGNLEDASMTILSGEFAMIMFVTLTDLNNLKYLLNQLNEFGRGRELSVTVRQLKKKAAEQDCHNKTVPYLISVYGRDKSGIVFRVSDFLAKNKLNITDLNSKLIYSAKKPVYVMFIEIDIPKRFSLLKLKKGLKKIASVLHVDLSIKPVEPLSL